MSTVPATFSCCPHTDPSDPAEHTDDSYGGCVICSYYVPHTDDERVQPAWPCPVGRLAALEAASPALDVERVSAALDRAWLDSSDAQGMARPVDLARHLHARLTESGA